MNHWRSVPLLNTCLGKLRLVSSNIQSPMTICMVISLAVFVPSIVAQSGGNSDVSIDDNERQIDVLMFDLSCQENTTCEPYRPAHLIEYFGADWCEPCQPLEMLLESIDNDDVAIIQHHPSVLDLSYLNYSKNRFDNTYRLLFIPSLVINSEVLLTGGTQGLELNQSLVDLFSNFSGIDNLSMSNGILHWNTTTNHDLTVWKLEPTKHEFENRTLSYLAIDKKVIDNSQRQYDLSEFIKYSNGSLVFILEDSEPKSLSSISTSPTGEKSLTQEEEKSSNLLSNDGSYNLALITFLGLFLCLLPALISFRNLQKQEFGESE